MEISIQNMSTVFEMFSIMIENSIIAAVESLF